MDLDMSNFSLLAAGICLVTLIVFIFLCLQFHQGKRQLFTRIREMLPLQNRTYSRTAFVLQSIGIVLFIVTAGSNFDWALVLLTLGMVSGGILRLIFLESKSNSPDWKYRWTLEQYKKAKCPKCYNDFSRKWWDYGAAAHRQGWAWSDTEYSDIVNRRCKQAWNSGWQAQQSTDARQTPSDEAISST